MNNGKEAVGAGRWGQGGDKPSGKKALRQNLRQNLRLATKLRETRVDKFDSFPLFFFFCRACAQKKAAEKFHQIHGREISPGSVWGPGGGFGAGFVPRYGGPPLGLVPIRSNAFSTCRYLSLQSHPCIYHSHDFGQILADPSPQSTVQSTIHNQKSTISKHQRPMTNHRKNPRRNSLVDDGDANVSRRACTNFWH